VLSEANGPDLRVGAVEVKARDGGRCVIRGDRNTVSATIRNAGNRDAGQFSVEATVGGERRGQRSVGSLAAGAETKVEIHDVGVAEGERSLRVAADPANAVAEQDEANNTASVNVDCTRR
jgi:subtilase family serine protease